MFHVETSFSVSAIESWELVGLIRLVSSSKVCKLLARLLNFACTYKCKGDGLKVMYAVGMGDTEISLCRLLPD